jgi:apolipoprotein N-acyltransferase
VAGAGLREIDWTRPSGQPITVRLLQGNVPQEMKFAPEQVQSTLTLYENMLRAAPADLIATPETALPLLLQQLPGDYLQRLQTWANNSDSHLLLGVPISDNPQTYSNSVLGFGPEKADKSASAPDAATALEAPLRLYRYDKHHLVPFGEFIPTGAKWFVNLMSIPLGDFTRGPAVQAPFPVKDQMVMPNICYEDLFGEEIADQIAAAHFAGLPQPTILLNMSNIAWFGDSIALPQHLQISRMRTLETGRPMLRATNTGATAVIGPKGELQEQLTPYSRGTLAVTVQGMSGWTPYILLGNWLPVSLASAMLAALWLLRRKAG